MKLMILAVSVVSLAGCFVATQPPGSPVTQSIGPAGGNITSADGLLELAVPAGALSSTQTLTITTTTASPVPTSAAALGVAYQLSPASLALALPIHLTLSPPTDSLPQGQVAILFAAPEGQVAVQPMPSTMNDQQVVSASISTLQVVQLAHDIAINPTSGSGGAASTSATTGGTSGTTGSVGPAGCTGGAMGTSGGPGTVASCEVASENCDGTPGNDVICVQGNCACRINGQVLATHQYPTNDCNTAWSDCGYPPNPPLVGSTGGSSGGGPSTGGTAGGGSATITGPINFDATVNDFSTWIDTTSTPATNDLALTLAQNGLCGGFEATGVSLQIGVFSADPVTEGTYALVDASTGSSLGSALTLNDWDVDAGSFGPIGTAISGSVTVTSLDGGVLSGSFQATFGMNDGSSSSLSGTFSSVPACIH